VAEKFKVGDKVRYIGSNDYSDLRDQKVYVVSKLRGDNGVYLEGFSDTSWWYDYRFELVEAGHEATDTLPAQGAPVQLLEISYNGVTVSFDPTKKQGKILVDAVIDAIYNGLSD
jgi:hypothetical protein